MLNTITAFKETKTIAEWAEDPRCQVLYGTLKSRLQRGWEVRRAITTPPTEKTKHGDNQLGNRTKLYQVWIGMRARCSDPKHISYKSYGHRGIRVDPRWDDYGVFKKWALQNGYALGLEIDREDNDGHYCPENCRWVTKKENRRRASNHRRIVAFGESKTLMEWSEDSRCKCPYYTLRTRMNRRWEPERAISTPPNPPGIWHQPRRAWNKGRKS